MRVVIIFFLFISALYAQDPYKGIIHYKLDNGLNVYLYPDSKAKNVQINAVVNVGMRAEDKKSAGISHLVEHIVFRDQRVEDKDYLNLFKDNGALYVNGYTKEYETEYLVTINPKKIYWVVENFAQMLLDKNVTDEDLRSEKGALQVEIGEVTWVDKYLPNFDEIFDNLKWIFPPRDEFFKDEFGIDVDEEMSYISSATYRLNNQKFTLQDVMSHYMDYYYPSNITLNIAGNFDKEKMINTIESSFGKFKNSGSKSIQRRHYKIAKLNNKPYKRYDISMNGNSAYIGVKFISNKPKKIIILDSYVDALAERLSKVFRNQNGESYGVHGYSTQYHNGAIAAITFSSPYSAFDKNIAYAKEQILKDVNGSLTDEQIKDAIKKSKEKYTSVEHDSDSLMSLIFNYQNFYKTFEENKTPYEILNSVTVEEFREVLKDSYIPENLYQAIYRSHYFFPYDFLLFFIPLLIFMLYIVYRLFNTRLDRRRVKMQRRLTGIFLTAIIVIFSMIVSVIAVDWFLYILIKNSSFIDDLWVNGYAMPLSYLVYFIDFLISILIIYIVIKLLFRWVYLKLYVTSSSLIISGVKNKYIDHTDIESIDVVPWSISKFKDIHGLSILFWKPLVRIRSKLNEVIYLRAKNARHLKHDLEAIIFEKDKKIRL